MAEESEGAKFFNRLKEATASVVQKTQDGIDTYQTKRELSQAYSDLGQKTAELVESGTISHPDLTDLVTRIDGLKAELEAAADDSEAPEES